MDDEILTIKEVAAYLKLTEKTAYRLAVFRALRWVDRGGFAVVKLNNGLMSSRRRVL